MLVCHAMRTVKRQITKKKHATVRNRVVESVQIKDIERKSCTDRGLHHYG